MNDKKFKKKLIDDSDFIQAWKDDMILTMSRANPEWDKKDMEDIIDEMLEEDLMVPEVIMDNNYTGENRQSNMISVLDWTIRRKPLIAGNATFYKPHEEAINPVAKMIRNFLIERKAIKKEMFKIEDQNSDIYKDLDRAQLNQKILANS